MVFLIDADGRGGIEDKDIFKYDALAGVRVRIVAVPLRARVSALFGVVCELGDLVRREHDEEAAGRLAVHRRGGVGEAEAVVIAVGAVRGARAVLGKEALQPLAGRRHAVDGAEIRRFVLAEAAASLVDLNVIGVRIVDKHRVGKFQTFSAFAAVCENRVIAERRAHKIAARAADGENIIEPVRIHEEEHIARDGLHLHLVYDGRLRKTALCDERAVVPVVIFHHHGNGARLAVVGVRLFAGQWVYEHRLRRCGRRGLGRCRRFGRGGNGGRRGSFRRRRRGRRSAAGRRDQAGKHQQKRESFLEFHGNAPRYS